MRSRRVNTLNGITIAGIFWVLLSVGACSPPITIPIKTIHYEMETVSRPRVLFVFLPGRGDDVESFQEHGIIQAVRERGMDVDMIAVDAHMGYYMNGTVFARLKQDVVEPAKANGYDTIWMIGDSLGGYGALSYVREYPNDVSGVVLLGPFLGREAVIVEIREAGGLNKWHPTEIKLHSEDEWDKQLWLWIKDEVEEDKFWLWVEDCKRPKQCSPKIYLGYGREDRFSSSQDFLASLMPPRHVRVIEGGHDWKTWKKLWNVFLDRDIFAVKPK